MNFACYGSEIYIRHEITRFFLFSVEGRYIHDRCSDQQIVAAVEEHDQNCLWKIKPAHGIDPAMLEGDPIRHGSIVRLEHCVTRKNLHCHDDRPAPTTSDQHEVTCYGERGIGNTDDNWKVELLGGAPTWEIGKPLRLIHQRTEGALHSHHSTFSVPVGQFQEVTCHPKGRRDGNDVWLANISPHAESDKSLSRRTILWIDWLGVIGSVASITGLSLLWLKDAVGAVNLSAIITYGLASTGALGVALLVVAVMSWSGRVLLSQGKPVLWGIRFIMAFACVIAAGCTWILSVHLVRYLIDQLSQIVRS